jgi:hypothetical protein
VHRDLPGGALPLLHVRCGVRRAVRLVEHRVQPQQGAQWRSPLRFLLDKTPLRTLTRSAEAR